MLPEQTTVMNGVLMMFLIPAFDIIIYPCLKKIKVNFRYALSNIIGVISNALPYL